MTIKLKAANNKWYNHHFSTGCYTGDDYRQFERDCRSDLKKMAKESGLELHTFNKNHYCFSAVLTDGEKFVYVSVSDVRYFGWNQNTSVLIRSMAHAKDWTGGPNHQCKWSDVGSAAVEIIKRGC